MTLPHDTALLTLIQWLSPAFPIGSYTYSHGLEWAMAAGEVTDAASLQSWISDILRYGAGRSDAAEVGADQIDDHHVLGSFFGAVS